jgi:hypothetical protein
MTKANCLSSCKKEAYSWLLPQYNLPDIVRNQAKEGQPRSWRTITERAFEKPMKISSCKKKNYLIQQFVKGSPLLQTQGIEKFFLVALSGLGFIEEFFFATQ